VIAVRERFADYLLHNQRRAFSVEFLEGFVIVLAVDEFDIDGNVALSDQQVIIDHPSNIKSVTRNNKVLTRTPAVPMSLRSGKREAGAHPAVFAIYAMPKAKEGFGSALGRSFNVNSAAKLKFKNDFQAMKTLLWRTRKYCRFILAGSRWTVSVRNRALKNGRLHL